MASSLIIKFLRKSNALRGARSYLVLSGELGFLEDRRLLPRVLAVWGRKGAAWEGENTKEFQVI